MTAEYVARYIDLDAVIYDLAGDILLCPSVCANCGSLVVDIPAHDSFHKPPEAKRRWWWMLR